MFSSSYNFAQKFRELMKSQSLAGRRARLLAARRSAELDAGDVSALRRGLTLVELAIVILVLGVIMTIVIANLDLGIIDDAKKLQVKNAAKTLEFTMRRYEMDSAALGEGDRLGILARKNPNNPGWRPVDESLVMDPWGEEYFICLDDLSQKQICTYGADREPGGAGDAQDFFLTDKSSWPSWLSGKGPDQP
ncbi:MAG: type II secretion system protein GspG [bacterium]|nr:type II secretion system protein GspG [bacterium]